jgi:hypothetical protein
MALYFAFAVILFGAIVAVVIDDIVYSVTMRRLERFSPIQSRLDDIREGRL